jgi:hypothetical protein
MNLSQIFGCRNWETEHYNSVLERTVSFLGIHKWEPDIYIHLKCRKNLFLFCLYKVTVQNKCLQDTVGLNDAIYIYIRSSNYKKKIRIKRESSSTHFYFYLQGIYSTVLYVSSKKDCLLAIIDRVLRVCTVFKIPL